MSDTPQGPGWWQASDGKWYPPQNQPGVASAPQPTYPQTPPAYGGPPAFGAPMGMAPMGGTGTYASWGQRALAALIDYAGPALAIFIVAIIFGAISSTLGALVYVVGYLGLLAFMIWNLIQQGNTGQTIGKKQVGIKLISEATGQPVGAGMSIGRYFVHFVDSIACYIGWLFPLWDAKRQTFADKILNTIVVPA